MGRESEGREWGEREEGERAGNRGYPQILHKVGNEKEEKMLTLCYFKYKPTMVIEHTLKKQCSIRTYNDTHVC